MGEPMTAGAYNITIEQGATYSQVFTWKIDDNPVDITGYVVRMKLKATKKVSEIISLTSPSNGITLNSPTTGQFTISMSATTTESLVDGKYLYDIELQSPGGVVTRLLRGEATIIFGITR